MRVSAKSLVPSQRRINTRIRQNTDYYEQRMLKHKGVTYFLSKAALLQAGLYELDPNVVAYTPYPFTLNIGQRNIVPDFHLSFSSHDEVIFFNTNSKKNPPWTEPVKQFLHSHNMSITFVDPESILTRHIEAENCLEITRRIASSNEELDPIISLDIINKLRNKPYVHLKDLVNIHHRELEYTSELNLMWMLYLKKVHLIQSETFMNASSKVALC